MLGNPLIARLHENTAHERMQTNIGDVEPLDGLPEPAHVWIHECRIEEYTRIAGRQWSVDCSHVTSDPSNIARKETHAVFALSQTLLEKAASNNIW